MSQEVRQADLREKSQKLFDGPLKHIRGAALAAALLPLASVAVTPASAQTPCPSGGVCGTVFNDLNGNGIQDVGEFGLEGVKVTITDAAGPNDVFTDNSGFFAFFEPGGTTVTISTAGPNGFQASPSNVGDDTFDSDGVVDALTGLSVVTVVANGTHSDFGFFQSSASNPGTGTIGYWKNHPEAWPTQSIIIGGLTYQKAQAITWLGKVGKDKSVTMFAQLVAANLSVVIGNDDSCIKTTISMADDWMKVHPVGSNVAGSSDAWSGSGHGAALEGTLDAYNNGQLCAPHRQ